jgi:predicted Rossmann-fold nucleotide-binding protein
MEASAAGAREAGGPAIGVTCDLFRTFRSGPNPHASEIIAAPTLYARLETLIDRASAYVVLPGGVGTLIELSLTWEHLRRGLVPERPLVVWEEPWRAVVQVLESGPYADTGHELLTWVDSVEAAVAAIRARVPLDQRGPSGSSRSG